MMYVQPGVDTLLGRGKGRRGEALEFKNERKIEASRKELFAGSGAKGGSCRGDLGTGSNRTGLSSQKEVYDRPGLLIDLSAVLHKFVI